MPPKAKITKAMILNTVMEITRETGFEVVNARSVAGKLQFSTRPIFTCYKNMDELKSDFLGFAYKYFEQYVHRYSSLAATPSLVHPLSYIDFARDEPNLFKLLFVSDMALEMSEQKDFYKEADNEKRASDFSKTIGIEPERAKEIFLDLFLYAHGIAVLTANGKIDLKINSTEKMLTNVLSALVNQANTTSQKRSTHGNKSIYN